MGLIQIFDYMIRVVLEYSYLTAGKPFPSLKARETTQTASGRGHSYLLRHCRPDGTRCESICGN
jgi:hypothetical protein